MKIGLLSDTHGWLDPSLHELLAECDQIWHAGDLGSMELLEELQSIKPVVAVYGNIDEQKIRQTVPEHQRFTVEGLDVWMTHIGGYPPKYTPQIRNEIRNNPPNLFISGHSHILKVIRDPKLPVLHMNPGAAGKHGFHKLRTLLTFQISDGKITDLNAVELGPRAKIA